MQQVSKRTMDQGCYASELEDGTKAVSISTPTGLVNRMYGPRAKGVPNREGKGLCRGQMRERAVRFRGLKVKAERIKWQTGRGHKKEEAEGYSRNSTSTRPWAQGVLPKVENLKTKSPKKC
jgi:hypothetical protein